MRRAYFESGRCRVLLTQFDPFSETTDQLIASAQRDGRLIELRELQYRQYRPSSVHMVTSEAIDGPNWERLLVAGGGASGVHDHSALILDDAVYVAVGDSIVALRSGTGDLVWRRKADDATVFGLHLTSGGDALIVHGELAISRWTLSGNCEWEHSGRDIFTGELTVTAKGIEVVDFNGDRYLFSESGKALI